MGSSPVPIPLCSSPSSHPSRSLGSCPMEQLDLIRADEPETFPFPYRLAAACWKILPETAACKEESSLHLLQRLNPPSLT